MLLGVVPVTTGLGAKASAVSFAARTTAPSTSDSHWIHTSCGGLNECIQISGNSVLPNCVGYAWGRAYEILGKRPDLCKGNAGTWYAWNKQKYDNGQGGYPYSPDVTKPALGAIAVWAQAGDVGHVAVVEAISGTSVTTSESGYLSDRFWTTNRSTTSANLSAGSSYTFLGYIYILKNATVDITPSRISFESNTVNNITYNSATISAWVTNLESNKLKSIGFLFGTSLDNLNTFTCSENVYWTRFLCEYKVDEYYGILSPGTTYYYRFFVVEENGGASYTSEMNSFTTTGAGGLGGFDSIYSSNIAYNSGIINGWIRNPYGEVIKSYGFYFGESRTNIEKYVIGENVRWTDFLVSADVSDYYGALNPCKQYYFRFYCLIDAYYFSDVYSFTTYEYVQPPHTHSYTSTTTKSATCTATGIKTFTCSCGDSYTESIPFSGHKYSSEYTVDKAATCTDAGSKSRHCTVCGAKTDVTAIPATGHSYTSKVTKAATCETAGVKTYTCKICGYKTTKSIAAQGHTPVKSVKKATQSVNGKITNKCSVCGKVTSTKTIYRIASVALSTVKYTYNGKAKTPSVIAVDSKGNTLKKNTDYTVKYASGRKAVGTYKVTVTFKGNYSGTKTLTFKINPKATAFTSLTPGKGKATLKWKAVSGVTGYELWYYSTSKKAYVKDGATKKTTYSFTDLAKGKTYKVKVRTYKTVSGTKYYSAFSPMKTVKAK